ncbi:MAG: tryptophan 2,3-dioxygenase family protein [Raineya sp.]|jgi:tryptophan 2,3-dioxygenase|nr:tryptophan 2,3-dioxygenase family protein [Raineya sp.]
MENNIESLLKKLEEKYSQTGQSLAANLEGLLYNDYLKYWDYIQVETLLTLQKPKTSIPDEMIFIMYHQITELYFRLILWEIEQIGNQKDVEVAWFLDKIERINRYLEALVRSFDIMSVGMEAEQFKKFRMALLPASGFQSAQFRMIEITSTNFINLTSQEFRDKATPNTTIPEIYEHIYWKKGATETATGKKTITLQHFEEKYSESFMQLAYEYRDKNIWEKYKELENKGVDVSAIKQALRDFDYLFNVEWALSHLKSAVRYLRESGKPIDATGGTNWTKYLPPNFQRIIFFPSLWTEEERQEWGRKKVEALLQS